MRITQKQIITYNFLDIDEETKELLLYCITFFAENEADILKKQKIIYLKKQIEGNPINEREMQ